MSNKPQTERPGQSGPFPQPKYDTPVEAGSGLSSSNDGMMISATPLTGAEASRLGNTSIPDNVATPVIWTASVFDNGSLLDIGGANPSHVKFDSAGWWAITAQVSWASANTGTRSTEIRANGVSQTPPLEEDVPASNKATVMVQLISMTFHALAAGYFEIVVTQDSGGALNMTNARVSVVKVGD